MIEPIATDEPRIARWNATERAVPPFRGVHALFEDHVRARPHAPAVELDGVGLTYAELNGQANAIGAALARAGARADTIVGISLAPTPLLVAAIIGVFKAGAAYLPLDLRYPEDALRAMVDDARPALVLTERLPPAALQGSHAETLVAEDLARQPAPDDLGVEIHPSSLAYTMFTSGSTGRAKGVMVEHRGLWNLAFDLRRRYGARAGTRTLQAGSFSFDGSLWNLLLSVMAGGRLTLVGAEAVVAGEELARILRERRITHVSLPPSVLLTLRAEDAAELRVMMSVGEQCPATLVERFAGQLALHNAYGPTETTIGTSDALCSVRDVRPSIGRPVANVAHYVAATPSELAPVGEVGELLVGGVGLARGYVASPALTADRFRPDRWSGVPGARLYCTGDLARFREDGTVELVGRADRQVKIRGFRVDPAEVEAALRAHPAVRDAAAIPVDEGPARRLEAWAAIGSSVEEHELKAFLRDRLPAHCLPVRVRPVAALPLKPSGKVDLAALFLDLDAPDRSAAAGASGGEGTEARIEEIWHLLLPTAEFGRDESFFDVGGHSLLLPKLQARLAEKFGAGPTLVEIFEFPTIRALAALLDGRVEPQPVAVVAVEGRKRAQASLRSRRRSRG